ncbi:bifunctional DNA primase/polymerase [Streptomyces hygroscopicus subsp. hygroscopicus]|uniref:bifunctional DNA primase/polymerase n=1 Tax=Streptomyces hygroscopicus TaxID=1912 RepID=UPI001C65840D|nr:bifunctional DNA primase/polymerase [Streptomyces hygroscopicus]MBW8088595.1 bifunctional DNA primase/polymerase [Streptomyces hygroscopicus subsp. hygroscopicus]
MTHDARFALLRAALDAAERGWHVFPLRPGTKRPALHGETSCPRTGPCAAGHRKWEQRATTDPGRIRAAWSRAPYNVGIATGPSGLVVVDLDMPKDKSSSDAPCGATTFAALCERAGHPVPTTYRTRTASGGAHLYFTAPDGARLTNTAGSIAPLVDTRARGGYVVAAGSITPAGPYEALCGPVAVPLPSWLQTILRPAPKPAQAPLGGAVGQSRRYADVALSNEVRNVAHAADGTRNATLLRAARALGRLIASGDLTRGRVENALREAAAANATQSQRYYDDVIRRGLDWSIAHNPTRGRAA